jgi:hypothetical protein
MCRSLAVLCGEGTVRGKGDGGDTIVADAGKGGIGEVPYWVPTWALAPHLLALGLLVFNCDVVGYLVLGRRTCFVGQVSPIAAPFKRLPASPHEPHASCRRPARHGPGCTVYVRWSLASC